MKHNLNASKCFRNDKGNIEIVFRSPQGCNRFKDKIKDKNNIVNTNDKWIEVKDLSIDLICLIK